MTATLEQALAIVATGRAGERHTRKAWKDAALALEQAAREGDQALIERLGNDNLDLVGRVLNMERNIERLWEERDRLAGERDAARHEANALRVQLAHALGVGQ